MADYNGRGPAVIIGKGMTEAVGRGTVHSPDSDCNSNHTGLGSNSVLSNTSSQDIDFIQDNSDYQWFLDYGYRDGGTHHHTSILSSLSESYGVAGDVGYYDTIAKNLDANLAEADMESFRTEDIHALLTNLPAMCSDLPLSQDANHEGEMYASVSGSMMAKFDFDSSISPHSSSQGEEDSVNSTDMSICKSELLFSPVKEVPMPGANFSMDSLDCELLNEHDIMLTCQANKDNYTIAFEGSITAYSEDSDFHDTDKSETTNSGMTQWVKESLKTSYLKQHHHKQLDNSMAQSDSGFTTWSKLKKRCKEYQLRRHPSGNNNTSGDAAHFTVNSDKTLKSQSMPNLHKQRARGILSSNYSRHNNMSNSSVDCCTVQQRIPVKLFDIHHQASSGSGISDMATSVDGSSSCSERNSKQQPPNFNLVKLFMKQKSLSTEGMSTAMDQSSASEPWLASQSEKSGDSFENSKHHKEYQEFQKQSLVFEDSLLVDGKCNEVSMNRKHDLIPEEAEDDVVSERSESVEQLSESISKTESLANSLENMHYPKCQNIPLTAKFSVNNNDSFEQEDSLIKPKTSKDSQASQTKPFSSNIIKSSLEPNNAQRVSQKSSHPYKITVSRSNSTQVPIHHLINKSMQTSYLTADGHHKAPLKVVEPSFLSKLKQEGEIKPVYVLYPNYTLPDLDFLKQKKEDVPANVVLVPQKFAGSPADAKKKIANQTKKRPFSCNDVEALRQKGFGHVRDWDSLNFLLPFEYRQILADVPEVVNQINNKNEIFSRQKPSFCASPPVSRQKSREHRLSCDSAILDRTNVTNVSSSSSTATQPSSGYRGSSTMLLTDSLQNSPQPNTNFNPLFVYRYDSVTSSEASLSGDRTTTTITTTTAPPLPKRSISLQHETKLSTENVPPRPPLPKGILRKSLENSKLRKNHVNTKRYSMFEIGDQMETLENKRRSLQDPYYISQRLKRFSETEDEGVDAGTSSSSVDEQVENELKQHNSFMLPTGNISCDELEQLEEFLKLSGISCPETDDLDENDMSQLRSIVGKFLSLKINQDPVKKTVSFAENLKIQTANIMDRCFITPPNSPNVAATLNQKQSQKTLVDMPICEETEYSAEMHSSPKREALLEKRALVSAVIDSVEHVIEHFSPAIDQTQLNFIGNSNLNPSCAKMILNTLCPALYAVLSDGLKPYLDTPFGAINNSVWQVIEASAQQGPLTKALNELVMKINSEDVITEGMVKFNAFVLGLLNVRSLDAWSCYFRTRETVLRKHYNPDALMLMATTGSATVRGLFDSMITSLQPLALLPFQIDLLFEYRLLHQSLKRMGSYHQPLSPTHHKPSPSPTNLTPKQWTLMKLVQSIQSNSTQSYDESEEHSIATILHRRTPDCSKDPPLPDLLNSSGFTSNQSRSEKSRPRSCVETGLLSQAPGYKLVEDITSVTKKRWSGIHPTSKLFQAFDKLASEDTEDEYTDSLEHVASRLNRLRLAEQLKESGKDDTSEGLTDSPIPSLQDDGPESLDSNMSDDKPLNGRKFKKLQMKWEMLSGRESVTSSNSKTPTSPTHTGSSTTPVKSKIPRLVTSPVRSSAIPVLTSPTGKQQSKMPVKKAITPPGNAIKKTVAPVAAPKSTNGAPLVKTPTKKPGFTNRYEETSRMDQLENTTNSGAIRPHLPRPSSLPYKPANASQGGKNAKTTPPRRAVSSSLNRKTPPVTKTPKVVRTLTHRLPSESGHLPFNEGERLKVVLDVDATWLLCCRGDRKGLVPKSAVISADSSSRF